MTPYKGPLAVVVPAAGVGKRMLVDMPKQYLKIAHQTVIEHTVERLLAHTQVDRVVVAVSSGDEYISETWLANHENVTLVDGGKERVDSVLAGLKTVDAEDYPWVLVHDAARPCLSLEDLTQLIDSCLTKNEGGLLAYPVRDTMKQSKGSTVVTTVDRSHLWHALTPQMYPTCQLIDAIEHGLANGANITDESSAIEFSQFPSHLITGSSDNIKITRPADLTYAEFIIKFQQTERENT